MTRTEIVAATASGEGTPAPDYGASDHYLGSMGKAYFESQSGGGDFAARIVADHFRPFIRPSDVVIDFGCGGGFLLRRLACTRRIGVEINPVARDCAIANGVECRATLHELSDGIADVVISNHALEHVPYPIDALRGMRSKLKPDGLLVLCVPIDNWRHQRRYKPGDRDHHLHTWTSQLLGNTLFEAGFEVESIDLWRHAWPGRWTVACYGRLPRIGFDAVCGAYSILTGRGLQLFAAARPFARRGDR